MLPLGGGMRLPVDVLEFTGTARRYLQLALVSRGLAQPVHAAVPSEAQHRRRGCGDESAAAGVGARQRPTMA
jgi:hypothetical protein